MADPRAFISFDYDHDATSKTLFVGQAKDKSPTSFTVADWSSKSSLPQAEWEKLIKDKINRCNLLIILVGKNMATASGVAKEIKMAADQNVPVSASTSTVVTAPAHSLPGWRAAGPTRGHGQRGSRHHMCMKEGKNK